MKPTRYEGSGIWRDAAEQICWYGNMAALEKAFAKEGILASGITAEMACKWRETGIAKKGKDHGAKARAAKATKAATAL